MIQEQVLNKILSTQDSSLIVLNNLTEDYFCNYKPEFNYILDHLNQYDKVPDFPTFMDKFPNFVVLEVNETNDFLLEQLLKEYSIRKAAATLNNAGDLLKQDKLDEVYTSLQELVENRSDIGINSVDILQDTSRYDDYIERSGNLSKYYISTGFPELDGVIGGWDRTDELATIVGRTNSCKTWCLLKMSIAALKQGLRVGLYSGEMSERKVGYRVDTLLGNISNGGLTHGNISIQQEYKQYIDELPKKFNGVFKVLTPYMVGGSVGVSTLKAFIKKENLDILFVDQHSLLEDDRKAKNPIERAANISKDLKNLQVMSRIPIISVSQQNRQSTENGVDTTMISQSDRIGQDSTVVIFVEKKEETLKLYIGKSRDSEVGKVLEYRVDLNRGMFTYIPNEEEDYSETQSTKQRYERDFNEQEGNVF